MSNTELTTIKYGDSLTGVMTNIAGQLAPRSRLTYGNDAQHFTVWLAARGVIL